MSEKDTNQHLPAEHSILVILDDQRGASMTLEALTAEFKERLTAGGGGQILLKYLGDDQRISSFVEETLGYLVSLHFVEKWGNVFHITTLGSLMGISLKK